MCVGGGGSNAVIRVLYSLEWIWENLSLSALPSRNSKNGQQYSIGLNEGVPTEDSGLYKCFCLGDSN